MSAEALEEQRVRLVTDLYRNDEQFAAAMPSGEVNTAIDVPGLRLPEIIRAVMEGYAERPALGQRAVELVTDGAGRTTAELLPRFETITYRELWERVSTVATCLAGDLEAPVRPGDRVCILGFASVDYTTIDMSLVQIGAVATSLATSAPITQLLPIVAETEPVLIAASVDYIDDAVELALSGSVPAGIVVFDYRAQVDGQREILEAAAARLAEAGSSVTVRTLSEVLERGRSLPATAPYLSDEPDPLRLLVYTSGSTGAPKGAMHSEGIVAATWISPAMNGQHVMLPAISLIFMPMSHVMGRTLLYSALGAGGTAYFAPKSDLSTLLEDLALVRPTVLSFVPRIWDMLFDEISGEVDRRTADGADRAAVEAEVMAEGRRSILGGRYVAVASGSAAISPEMKAWAEAFIDLPLVEGYGSTETGPVFADGTVRRPPVIDYKLVDVPDLGYFGTDRPHPRGELLVKTAAMFPGYYKRPELTAEVFDADGFYRTGDVVAELGPDQLKYLDRRNNVLKLSQGEFVAISNVEAIFANSPLVQQIYVYGNSARPYVLAVVVPTEDALSGAGGDADSLKSAIAESLQKVARSAGLQSYEIPRDFIVETTPFTLENGLLTGIRKFARPKLKERYGPVLEQRYADLAESQANELRSLRRGGSDRPVIEMVCRAAGALLGATAAEVAPDAHFTDLGGDSLSALTFAQLLYDVFDIDVPVSVIISPAADLKTIADYVETERNSMLTRPTFATVHGRDSAEAKASDLTLDKFIDAATLTAAPTLPRPDGEIRTVLLTGATGFLGRFLALDWLQRMDQVDGTLICLVRAKDDVAARARLDAIFDSGDPELLAHYNKLAADHLEVIAGDKGEENLGLDQQTWQRLADTVDLIVDPAALVNHLLPYSQLFGPNVVGTAELIRVALTTKLKQFAYVSTVGVIVGIDPAAFTEDADMRAISPIRAVNDTYTNGYGNSKWAGEVLLREAHDLCGLPVSVFRCGMILADTKYLGQLNVPDTFTRLILSLLATGVAPDSFYQLDDGERQRAHYDGLPVDFIAEAISTLGEGLVDGFQTYHVMNPYDDGVGLDQYVDWLIEAGHPIHRIHGYDEWFQRFETAIRGLPERQRQASLLPLLGTYKHPGPPSRGAMAPTDRFRSAVQTAKVGADKDIPHITAQVIVKYATDLKLLGLL